MSADDVEDFEAEAELLLYREYRDVVGPVSYTHLTLPTILLV